MEIILWTILGIVLFFGFGTVMFYYLIYQAMRNSSKKETMLTKIILQFVRVYAFFMAFVMMLAPKKVKKDIKKILP